MSGADPIGALSARIALQRPTASADDLGGAAVAYEPAGAVFAEPRATGVAFAAAEDGAPVLLRWELTIRAPHAVAPGWRAIWADGRAMRVRAVRPEGVARLVLTCEEEQA